VLGGPLMIQQSKAIFRKAYVLLIFILLFTFLLGQQPFLPGDKVYAQEPFVFTPNVSDLELTQTVEAMQMEVTEAPLKVWISGMWLYVGDKRFPIGDSFDSAEGIPLGFLNQTRDSNHGYGEIIGIENYVLIWITDSQLVKHFMVVSLTDPLFVGNENIDNGFEDIIKQMSDAENKMVWSGFSSYGGLGAILLAEMALCGPTAGAGCVSAIVTGIGGISYGVGRGIFHYVFEFLPNRRNLIAKFEGIDVLRP